MGFIYGADSLVLARMQTLVIYFNIMLAKQYIMLWRDTSPYEAYGIREGECTTLPVFRKLHTGYIRCKLI